MESLSWSGMCRDVLRPSLRRTLIWIMCVMRSSHRNRRGSRWCQDIQDDLDGIIPSSRGIIMNEGQCWKRRCQVLEVGSPECVPHGWSWQCIKQRSPFLRELTVGREMRRYHSYHMGDSLFNSWRACFEIVALQLQLIHTHCWKHSAFADRS